MTRIATILITASALLCQQSLAQTTGDIYNRLADTVTSEGGHVVTKGEGPANAFFRTLDAAQLHDLYLFCSPEDPNRWSQTGRESLRSGIAQRLGELDGKSAVEFFLDPKNREYYHSWGPVARGWAKVDPDAAFEWGAASEDKRHLSVVVQAAIEHHRDRVMGYLEHPVFKDRSRRTEVLESFGNNIIYDDGKAGWEWLQELPEEDREAVTPKLIGVISLSLPEKAAALALPSENAKDLTIAVGNWALSDPEAACAWLLATLPEEGKRDRLHRLAIAIWTELDAKAAWKHLSQLPEARRLALLEKPCYGNRMFLDPPAGKVSKLNVHHGVFFPFNTTPKSQRLADRVDLTFHMKARAVHGETLLWLIRPHLKGAERKELIRLMGTSTNKNTIKTARLMEANDLLATNPKRAIELADSVGEHVGAFIHTSIYKLAKSDPAAALRLAVLAERREPRIRNAVRASMSNFPEKTAEAVKAMPEGPDRTHAQSVLEDYRKRYLPKPVDYESMPPGEERNRAFATHLRSLRTTLPDDRIIERLKEYIAENEVGPAEDWMVDHLIPLWVKYDPGSLAAWAATQPESRRRFEALKAFARRWDEFGPKEAPKRLAALGIDLAELKSSNY